ncbi:MAG: DEAD/DEAH box helicase, partial [Verrucomicrobiota bacterium]
IRLNAVEILVVDEVDRMLDIGFLPAVKRIVQKCPPSRQTMVFSATLAGPIKDIAIQSLKKDHGHIAIKSEKSVAETIEHSLYSINSEQKFDFLAKLLDTLGHDKLIIFTRTKHGADKVSRSLARLGHATTELHSNRSQRQREHALMGLKNGKYRVLVATDIAARGIDIRQVSHVINYDVPEQPEDYVHRIGRTGRAEASGDALTLVTPEEERKIVGIERLLNQTIARKKLDDFPYKVAPRMETGRGSGGGGGSRGGFSRPQRSGGGGGFKKNFRPRDDRAPRAPRGDRFEEGRPSAPRGAQEDFRPGRPSGGGGHSSHAAPRPPRAHREDGAPSSRPAGAGRPSSSGPRSSGGSSRPSGGGGGGFKKSFGRPPRRD